MRKRKNSANKVFWNGLPLILVPSTVTTIVTYQYILVDYT